MKLLIDVEKDYYEMIKYNVEHGQEYKPFEIIANGIPYDKVIDEVTEVIEKIKSGELVIKDERPQNDIRWTDKVSVTSSGDIIDFEGRVVGHINLENIKGGAV